MAAKHRKKLWRLLLVVLMLLAVELPLRWLLPRMGYTIGSLAPNWQPMLEVDSLVVYESHYTDSLGITRANPVYWQKKGILINEEGFISGPFVPDSSKTSLLLLGDSFTWGSQAEPLDSSFASLLAQKPGWQVYNTGIPGADPLQYHAIAQQYIPVLKPDHVVVCFYTANDVMLNDRILQPHRPAYFVTNVGWLPTSFDGHDFKTAEESYAYYRKKYHPQNWMSKALACTATGTLLLSLPYRFQEREQFQQRKQSTWSYHYLELIRQLCEQHDASFTVVVIPDMSIDLPNGYADAPMPYLLEEYPTLFKGLQEEMLPLVAAPADYVPPPNGHFNNSGHHKAAQQIWQHLQ